MRLLYISRFLTALAAPVVMFPVIVWMQVNLGHEFALFPLYLFPVMKISWEFGWRGALLSIVAAVCCWLLASSLSGQPYSSEWVRYYNALMRGVVFLSGAFFILLFRRVVEQHLRRMEAMRALLNVCHGCGAVQGSDGRWIPFEELVKQQITRQSCECPTCAAAHKRISSQK